MTDVFEVSLVAVPAQPDAGVTKSKRYGGQEPPEDGEPPKGGDTSRANSLRLRFAEAKAKAAGSGRHIM